LIIILIKILIKGKKIELIYFLNHPTITTGDLAYVGL